MIMQSLSAGGSEGYCGARLASGPVSRLTVNGVAGEDSRFLGRVSVPLGRTVLRVALLCLLAGRMCCASPP